MIKLSSTLAVRQEIGLGTSAYERKKVFVALCIVDFEQINGGGS